MTRTLKGKETMNAIVNIGMNFPSLHNPTRAERSEAAEKVNSMAKATVLGAASETKSATKAAATAAEATEAAAQSISGDDFLLLLVTQMQNQDPLEPMDNADMLAQLAQFTSLEQMNELTDRVGTLSGNIDQLNFISANSLLGREIDGIDMNGDLVTGEVEGVTMESSIVYLAVGDSLVSMAGVVEVR
jgi:flagellar basal-body rod modification protein FlgD